MAGQACQDQHLLDDLSRLIRQDPGLPRGIPTASYWQQPPIEFPAPPSPPDEVDIAIIGSGITGCSVARHLLEGHATTSVVMLEARKATSGATGRNGGHIKATPEISFSSFAPALGDEKAQDIVHFNLKNVRELLALPDTLSSTLQQQAEVRSVEAINIYTTEDGFRAMVDKLQKFNTANPQLADKMKNVSSGELAKQYGILNSAGGFVSQAGAAWPYRLIAGILSEQLERHGKRFQLYEDTPVTSIEYMPDNFYRLATPSGSLKARTVVHATNGHAAHLLPGLRGMLFPVRGQMTAQTPTGAFGVQGGQRSWSVHYNNGFDYITQSGRTGEIFAGGGLTFSDLASEIGSTEDTENAPKPVVHLQHIMDKVFGTSVCENTKATWTGVMGFTADGLPLVGKLPRCATGRDGDQEWIAAGYNGYGMANAWLSGKYIAESILRSSEIESVPQAYYVTDSRLERADIRRAAEDLWEAFGSKKK